MPGPAIPRGATIQCGSPGAVKGAFFPNSAAVLERVVEDTTPQRQHEDFALLFAPANPMAPVVPPQKVLEPSKNHTPSTF